jgi:hypothetical protein
LLRELNDGVTPRGRSAKSIKRILSKGKERRDQAIADGVDLSVLPPDSKIRKRTEATWARLLKHGLAAPKRGQAGREAARKGGTIAKRSRLRRTQALELHQAHPNLTEIQIADRLDPPLKSANPEYRARTVRRYLTGR